ncbi:ATP-binding protein [Streptomyces sp. NPDC127190]|uniref:ATP-binding protein n=1 Tax=unclassified Streptomyces TaxID=2593676 RepID=UPI003634EBF4
MTTTASPGLPALRPLTGPVPGYMQTLPLDPTAAAVARLSVRTALACWGLEHMTDDVVLVVSELVTNAVQHARPASPLPDDPGTCRLTLEHPDAGTVWVSVADASGRRAVRRPADDYAGGWRWWTPWRPAGWSSRPGRARRCGPS